MKKTRHARISVAAAGKKKPLHGKKLPLHRFQAICKRGS
jgi:hypothetical protein